MVSKSPVWLLGLAPVVEAEHDGEGAGRQQFLVAVVIQAVSRCQGKSVANLKKTLQELRMLSSVTINCQITKIVMNSGSQLSVL